MESTCQPTLLPITKDLIENFARQIPGSMPEGWTSNVLVSLIANKFHMNDYGPYYNYCIEKSSEGESSLDKESQSSFSSNESFEVFFPTIRGILDYHLDSRLYETSQDLKLCDQRQPCQLLITPDESIDEEELEKVLRNKGYLLTRSRQECILKGNTYIKFRFENYKHAYKAYKYLSGDSKLVDKVNFLLKKFNKTVPPSVVIRNIPEAITFEQMKQKVKQLTQIDILEYVKPFKLRETYNSILTASSIKDCEIICYYLHKKNLFYKGQATKCTIHPLSMRTNLDTNFVEYLRPNTLNLTYSKLIPHWERLHTTVSTKKVQNEDEQEGEITIQTPVPQSRHNDRKISKGSYK